MGEAGQPVVSYRGYRPDSLAGGRLVVIEINGEVDEPGGDINSRGRTTRSRNRQFSRPGVHGRSVCGRGAVVAQRREGQR